MDPDLQRRQEVIRNIDLDSGHPFVKVNHPASGDIVNSPVHVAGYGTEFSYSPSYQLGVVEAFEPSPKDGTPLNMVRVPIIFDASITQQQS